MPYLLDADVLIRAKNDHYGFDLCPGFWAWLDEANSKGILFSVKQVRKELLELKDPLSKWIKPRKHFFLDAKSCGKAFDSFRLLSTWVSENYQPAAQAHFLSRADFDLVGYAHAHSLDVVTHERPANGFHVKIPNACNALGFSPISPFEMLKREKAKFILGK